MIQIFSSLSSKDLWVSVLFLGLRRRYILSSLQRYLIGVLLSSVVSVGYFLSSNVFGSISWGSKLRQVWKYSFTRYEMRLLYPASSDDRMIFLSILSVGKHITVVVWLVGSMPVSGEGWNCLVGQLRLCSSFSFTLFSSVYDLLLFQNEILFFSSSGESWSSLNSCDQLRENFSCTNEHTLDINLIILSGMASRRQEENEDSDSGDDESECLEKVEIRRPKIERIDKFKTMKRIVINVSMTQYPVVSEVAEDMGWKIQTSNEAGDWDIYWTDFAIDPDILIKMHLFQKINHYPGIHVIARKNLLGLGLMGMRNRFPDEYNFFPLTWMLPHQYAQFRAYYEDKPKGKTRTYIAKPEAECQGRGIFLTRKIEDFQNGKHYVIQRYVARPYLIDNLKFDMRIYVLLCGTDPMRLYIYNEGLARLATETYVEPSSSNLEKQFIHLTNYAINKNNPKFIFNSNINNMGVGHKRSLTAIYKQLAAKGLNIDILKEKIRDLTIKTVITGLPLMAHQYKFSQPQDYTGSMCFHILGLDVMLNSKGEPILIQVNHTPSFTTDTPLDYKIKSNLIKDTLTLLNINVKQKGELIAHAKLINKERLLTGKRHIYQGAERQAMLKGAHQLRDEYEDRNLGGFERVFPCRDPVKQAKYQVLIEGANRNFLEQNGSIRMKMEEKEGRKQLTKRTDEEIMSRSAIPDRNKEERRNEMSASMRQCVRKDIFNNTHTESMEDEKEDQLRASQIQLSGVPAPAGDLRSILIKSSEAKHALRLSKDENLFKLAHGIGGAKDVRRRVVVENELTGYLERGERAKSITHASSQIKSSKYGTRNPQLPAIQAQINDLALKSRRIVNSKPMKNQRSEGKSQKLMDRMARDMRDIIGKRGPSGGYVMPKIFCLNFEMEKRSHENNANYILLRKGLLGDGAIDG